MNQSAIKSLVETLKQNNFRHSTIIFITAKQVLMITTVVTGSNQQPNIYSW